MHLNSPVGLVSGTFDLLHAGHLYFLDTAARQCATLLVALHADPTRERANKPAPIQSVYERWCQLTALSVVHQVIPYHTERDFRNILATQPIQRRFLTSDHRHLHPSAVDLCEHLKIEIIYIPRINTYSSMELRERILWANQQK